MNEASRWRLDIARRLAEFFAPNPKVEAAVVGGSVARGIADADSDLDSLYFCSELPTQEELEAIAAKTPGKNWLFNPGKGGIGVECRIGRARVEVAHVLTQRMEDQLADVVERFDTDPAKHKSVGGMLDAVPLYGEARVRRWQEKAAAYPDGLALAMVNRHLHFLPLWILRDYTRARQSPLYQYELLCKAQSDILGVLCGINRLYHPYEFKWLDYYVGRMPVAPADLAERLKEVFALEPHEAMTRMGGLIEEVFDLVEEHLPAAKLAEARQVYALPEQRCEDAPDLF